MTVIDKIYCLQQTVTNRMLGTGFELLSKAPNLFTFLFQIMDDTINKSSSSNHTVVRSIQDISLLLNSRGSFLHNRFFALLNAVLAVLTIGRYQAFQKLVSVIHRTGDGSTEYRETSVNQSINGPVEMRKDDRRRGEPQGVAEPPDGGWGWMVVCGSALSHTFLIPVMQNFTLLFKDRFLELDFTATQITTLVSLNASFGMIMGLLNGPLLKKFGYRKLALGGTTLYLIGILCTGIAKSYIEFIIFYGLLSSLGMVEVMASFSLAINSYFMKNRSKAVGYSMTLTGLGPIVMPYVISYLLSSYGLKWTVFLLSGLNLHAYVGALLLQPVRWHMKTQNQHLQQENKESKILLPDVNSFLELSVWDSRLSLPSHCVDHSTKTRKAHSREYLNGGNKEMKKEQKPRKLSVTFLDNDDYKNMMNSTLHMIEIMDVCERHVKCASAETLYPEYGDRQNNPDKSVTEPLNPKLEGNGCEAVKREVPSREVEKSRSGLFCRFFYFVKDLYDLDLLRDPFYINIIIGLSVAFVGEIVFSTMTPIILREMGFSTQDTATFMSVVAGCDLLCRFIAPFVGKMLKLNSKKMYLIALLMLLLSRASLYPVSSYNACLLVSFGLGIGKGFRSVFWVLVLPDYVPISKLPSASALQSLINGILILISGPLIGVIIGLTNSYLSIIAVSNILTLTTILLWTGELLYLYLKKKG